MQEILTAALARRDTTPQGIARARGLVTAALLANIQSDRQVGFALAGEAVPLFRALGMKRELGFALLVMTGSHPDRDASRQTMSESRALLEEVGDRWGIGMLLLYAADGAFRRGHYDAVRGSLIESLALFRQLGDTNQTSSCLTGLGRLACVDGDHARARALVEEALAIRKRPEFDNPRRVAMALMYLGEIERCAGDPARGAQSFEEALATGRELGDGMMLGWSLHNLGHVALHSGDLEGAFARFRESLLLRWQLGPGAEVAAGLAGMAGVALRVGQLIEAVRLFGAAGSMVESTGFVLPQADEQVRRVDLAAIRLQLDDGAFVAAFAEGHTAKFEDLEAMVSAVRP